MPLTQEQTRIKGEIAAYGERNGFTDEQIQVAINVAFIESSLGMNMSNPESTASGLFQYLDGSWDAYHSALGNKNDSFNQITAFYNDLSDYSDWYYSNETNKNIPNDLAFAEYVYVKHHDGRGYSNFGSAPGRGIREFR